MKPVIGDADAYLPVPDGWHLHSAGPKGVTFHCDFINDVDSALDRFKSAMKPVMDAWPMTKTQISITIG